MDWSIIIDPLKQLLTVILMYLPNIIGALFLLIIAWILATVLRIIVRKTLRATKIDEKVRKGELEKEEKQYPVAQGAGTAVYWLIWLFFLLAILETLGVKGMLNSIVLMFEKILAAVPNIIAAGIVLAIFYIVGRLVAGLITRFLTSVRFNEIVVKLGLAKKPTEGKWSPSSVVGNLVLVLLMLFALMMAADLLNFSMVNELVSQFTQFFTQVILAIIILGIGIFLADLVAKSIKGSGQPQSLATIVKALIMVLVIALALRTMGFANDIILLAFGLMLGAIAVAVALAFGLGGREVARDQLNQWIKSLKSEKDSK
jgi:hypothetical protein